MSEGCRLCYVYMFSPARGCAVSVLRHVAILWYILAPLLRPRHNSYPGIHRAT